MNDENLDLKIPNQIAATSTPKKIIYDLDQQLIESIKRNNFYPKPLHICSGGTTSQCFSNNKYTFDLRKNFNKIIFSPDRSTIEIGTGTKMWQIIEELYKKNKVFPIGLSGNVGAGYLLTGGISPIGRNKGLAVDHIEKFRGIWGTGEKFNIEKPKIESSQQHKEKWNGLITIAPFLGIITNITLRTFQNKSIKIYQSKVSQDELCESIIKAEKWPENISLQWAWADDIIIYIIIEIDKDKNYFDHLIKDLSFFNPKKFNTLSSFKEAPKFIIPFKNTSTNKIVQSEVLGLLGKDFKEDVKNIVNNLSNIIKYRPHSNCFLACQQTGGKINTIKNENYSTTLRNSSWKPWINGAWDSNDLYTRGLSLKWMQELWDLMEPFCDGIHLAQMHQHLNWHQKETELAFRDLLPELKTLKSKYDPNGILPSL